jgi:hypothetical protein
MGCLRMGILSCQLLFCPRPCQQACIGLPGLLLRGFLL